MAISRARYKNLFHDKPFGCQEGQCLVASKAAQISLISLSNWQENHTESITISNKMRYINKKES